MPTGLSPTARALRTLEILQARPATTADELAAALGVTERAARRYVGILREAGIPVESTRGPYGGYRLGRGVRLPPVVFTEEQALGLVMAVLDGQPAAIDADDLIGSALAKVIRVLPDGIGRQAAALHAHVSAVSDRRSIRPDPGTLSALVAAVADRRRVLVTYRVDGGEEWDAEVDPWAVVVRYGRWYLLCHSHRADAIRTYRVDRIRAARQTPHGFTPPDDLDPPADGPPRAGRRPVRAGRQHPESRHVRAGVARQRPVRLLRRRGPELYAAVAAVAARFGAAITPGGRRRGELTGWSADAVSC